jgi:hypothetical protein
MAHVEIYRLKKTVDPAIRDLSVFDYTVRGAGPDPIHYVREWTGEMYGTMPLTIPGRLMSEPPKDYHGGEIRNGDIVVVDGTAYFMDCLQGSKFIELDSFDAGSVRQAQLRPPAEVIPEDADKAETDYPAEEPGGFDDGQLRVFYAAVEGGLAAENTGMAGLINITENPDCFDLLSAFTEREYGVPAAPAPDRDTEPEVKPVMVQNTDLAALLLAMHAVGGDYMRDAGHNVKTLAAGGDDFFIMANAGMLVVTPARPVFRRDTHEHEMWMQPDKSPDIRTFVMSVTGREDGRITGNVFEAGLYDLQDCIRDSSFFFTHLDAEMKNGASRRFTLEEWDAMDRYDRDRLKSWVKHCDPADEARIETRLDVLRRDALETGRPGTAGEFLSEINRGFMSRAENPPPDMLRVAPEAAREILAQNAAHVFRLMPNNTEPLPPIDALKIGQYPVCNEFAVRRRDWEGIEKWARRASGEMLRQNGRGLRDKSEHKGEEL